MRLLALLILLAFGGVSLTAPAPVLAQCGEADSYADTILQTQATHLIAYWQLGETSGTTAEDTGAGNYDGTYNGATLAGDAFVDGAPAPTFDGVNDFVDVYSAGLASAFDGDTGSALVWVNMSSANWSTTTRRRALVLGADNSNRVLITKSNVSNQVQAGYISTGANSLATFTRPAADAWFSVVVTWSKPDDRVRVYANGTQQGSTLTGLGTWIGTLSSTISVIGAANATPVETWLGSLAHVAIWKTELTAAEVLTVSTPPDDSTPTPCPTSEPPALAYVFTLEPVATGQPGQPVEVQYEMTLNGVVSGILLFAVWLTILIALVIYLLQRKTPNA